MLVASGTRLVWPQHINTMCCLLKPTLISSTKRLRQEGSQHKEGVGQCRSKIELQKVIMHLKSVTEYPPCIMSTIFHISILPILFYWGEIKEYFNFGIYIYHGVFVETRNFDVILDFLIGHNIILKAIAMNPYYDYKDIGQLDCWLFVLVQYRRVLNSVDLDECRWEKKL